MPIFLSISSNTENEATFKFLVEILIGVSEFTKFSAAFIIL